MQFMEGENMPFKKEKEKNREKKSGTINHFRFTNTIKVFIEFSMVKRDGYCFLRSRDVLQNRIMQNKCNIGNVSAKRNHF